MSKDRRLGRGLAALLGEPLEASTAAQPSATHPGSTQPSPVDPTSGNASSNLSAPPLDTAAVSADTIALSVDEIDENPFQPRRDFGETEIASLAESLKEHELLQPVLVRRVGERFQLISGERRLRAAIRAGWKKIPARVRDADDRLVAELAIVENLQRKDLNPIEKALSFRRYLDQHGCTQEDLARRLKIDRSTIANLVRLLELPDAVTRSVSDGSITAGHARALLPLGDESLQVEACNRIRSEGLSVRDTEQLIQETIRTEDGFDVSSSVGKKRGGTKSHQLAALEKDFRMALGTKVDVKQTASGKGRIVIHFSSADEFDRLRGAIIPTDDVPNLKIA